MNEWSPLQFSDYMDEIINSTSIPYTKWSEVYRHLKGNHTWIQEHECAGKSKRLSPEVESYVHSVFEGSPLDLNDVARLAEYAINEASAGRNDKAISKLKHLIECMARVIISNQSMYMSSVLERSYWNRLMLELTNAITFYCATVYNSYLSNQVPKEKYDFLADLITIALIATPRENNYKVAIDILLQLLAEVNMQRGMVLRKEVENIKDMPWSLEQAVNEVRHLLIRDNILNRIKLEEKTSI